MISWWRKHFLGAELGAAFLVTASFVAWAECWGGSDILSETLKNNRAAIYGSLASIFGSLLGFVMATVSIVLGFSGSARLKVVRESKHYPTVWKVFVSAIKFLGAGTLIALVCLVLDRDSHPRTWLLYVFVLLGLICAARLARCVWVLENVIELVTSKSPAQN